MELCLLLFELLEVALLLKGDEVLSELVSEVKDGVIEVLLDVLFTEDGVISLDADEVWEASALDVDKLLSDTESVVLVIPEDASVKEGIEGWIVVDTAKESLEELKLNFVNVFGNEPVLEPGFFNVAEEKVSLRGLDR